MLQRGVNSDSGLTSNEATFDGIDKWVYICALAIKYRCAKQRNITYILRPCIRLPSYTEAAAAAFFFLRTARTEERARLFKFDSIELYYCYVARAIRKLWAALRHERDSYIFFEDKKKLFGFWRLRIFETWRSRLITYYYYYIIRTAVFNIYSISLRQKFVYIQMSMLMWKQK